MKKFLNGTVRYNGKPARIIAKITDERGYISITADLIPYRCKTVHACGCLHDEIIRAFPKLRPYIWLHLYNLDGTKSYQVENSLYHLFNNDIDGARNELNCTDQEIRDLAALAEFGLHKTRKSYGYTYDKNALSVYENAVNKLNLVRRHKAQINRFYKLLADL